MQEPEQPLNAHFVHDAPTGRSICRCGYITTESTWKERFLHALQYEEAIVLDIRAKQTEEAEATAKRFGEAIKLDKERLAKKAEEAVKLAQTGIILRDNIEDVKPGDIFSWSPEHIETLGHVSAVKKGDFDNAGRHYSDVLADVRAFRKRKWYFLWLI